MNREQWPSVEAMRDELLARRKQLDDAKEHVASLLRTPGAAAGSLDALKTSLGAPLLGDYLRAGDLAPLTGGYHVLHHQDCLSKQRLQIVRRG